MPDLVRKFCTAVLATFFFESSRPVTVWRCLLFSSLMGATLALPQPVRAEAQPSGFWGSFGLEQLAQGLQLRAHALLLERIAQQGGTPSHFTTDGCSGGLSASWQQIAGHWPGFAGRYQSSPPFEACCITHDRAYHGISGARSPAASYAARLQADQLLRHCVRQVGAAKGEALAAGYGVSAEVLERGFWHLSQAMYVAVRFGGGPCSGLPWRWGYGYPGC